jgi:pilus assembly protein Flp/PilA
LSKTFHPKFTLRKNSRFRRVLRDRINGAAIVAPLGSRMVTVLRTPARPSKVRQPRVHMELPMKNLIARFVKDESGATAIEYGLIAAGISLAIIAAVNGLGSKLNTNFNSINTSLK